MDGLSYFGLQGSKQQMLDEFYGCKKNQMSEEGANEKAIRPLCSCARR